MKRPFASFRTPGGRFFVPVLIGVLAVGAGLVAWVARPWEFPRIETVQDGLEHPWDIAFAADGRMLVTERAGRVRVYADGEPGAALLHIATIPDVRAELESGLMGIAVAGDRAYVCGSIDPGGDDADPWRVDLLAAVLRPDGSLTAFEPLPLGPTIGGPRHQGCAVEVFDGELWLTIGDANLPAGENPAQDPDVLNGSVLRLTLDGGVPADAAHPSGAHSIGHRNPQGLAFRSDGLVIGVEHGTDTNDEINVIVPGGNYGYPCYTGAADPGPIPDGCGPPSDYLLPAWTSGSPTLATSAAVFLEGPAWGSWDGSLVVSTLKEEDLRRFTVSSAGDVSFAETLLDGRYGRLRALSIGPDGSLYISTSNGDDRILRIRPSG
jgi:glucose/arabinose dehydrogenase